MKVRRISRIRPRQGLPAPTMDEAPGGDLDLQRAARGAHARTPGELIPQPGDEIGVRFGDYVWPRQPFADRSQAFHLPAAEIARYLGSEVVLAYALFRDGVLYPSDNFPVTVPGFEHGDSRLTQPVFEQGFGGILSLRVFSGDATAAIEPWLFMAEGQAVWLDVDLATPSGNVTTIELIQGERVTAEMVVDGIEATLQRSVLEAADENTVVTLHLKVTFDDSGDENRAIRFPSSAYRLTHGALEILSDFSEIKDRDRWIIVATPYRLSNDVLLSKLSGFGHEVLTPFNARDPIVGSHLELLEGPLEVRPPLPVTHFHLDMTSEGRVIFQIYDGDQLIGWFNEEPTEGKQVQYTSELPFTSIRLSYVRYFTDNARLDNILFRT